MGTYKGEKMKNLTLKVLTMFMASVSIWATAQAAEGNQNVIKEIAVSVNGVYIPSGFTNQSDAYVVVNGLFPNGCYSLSQPKVKHVTAFEHEVQTVAKVRQGICLRVLVPFNQEIPVGKLTAGQHTFRFLADDGTSIEKQLEI